MLKTLEAATGFEPVNNGFADRCLSHLAMPPAMGKGPSGSFANDLSRDLYASNGAGNGTRTRDNHVGNVRLYQLSYSRSKVF